MTRITESDIEELVIELLEEQGWDYVYGPDIAPEGESEERESFEDVVLWSRLESAIRKNNPQISDDGVNDVFR